MRYKMELFGIIISIILIIISLGTISSVNLQHFDSTDISFDYPNEWYSISPNGTEQVFFAEKQLYSNRASCVIGVMPLSPRNDLDNESITYEQNEINYWNATRKSLDIVTVDGQRAYKLILDENNPKTGHIQIESIRFYKNNKSIVIKFESTNINDIQKDIDLIIRNFHVK